MGKEEHYRARQRSCLLRQVTAAKTPAAAVDPAAKLGDAVIRAGSSARTTAGGADRADEGSNELSIDAARVEKAGDEAVSAGEKLEDAAEQLRGSVAGPLPTLAQVRKLAGRAERRATQAAEGAEDALDLVTREDP